MTEPPRPPGIAERIRVLAAAGHSRADIARMVDRSYQQVRQVLVLDEARARRNARSQAGAANATGVSEQAGVYEHKRAAVVLHGIARILIAADGSAILPAEIVGAVMAGAGQAAGQTMIGRATPQGLLLMGPAAALDWVREGIPQWQPGEPLWSDALIADRRAEVARETDA